MGGGECVCDATRARHTRTPYAHSACDGDKYERWDAVMEHAAIAHPGTTFPKPFACDVCEYSVCTEPSLISHYLNKHGTTRPRQSSPEAWAFPYLPVITSPRAHQSSSSQTVAPRWNCSNCTKSYLTASKSFIKKHQEVCTTTKPAQSTPTPTCLAPRWNCSNCTKSYLTASKSFIKKHQEACASTPPAPTPTCISNIPSTSSSSFEGLVSPHVLLPQFQQAVHGAVMPAFTVFTDNIPTLTTLPRQSGSLSDITNLP
jgi:hypothetical protein